MKNKIFKGLLSLILITMVLPAQSQDFMNIFFKNGDSRKFYLNEIIEFKATNIDTDGVLHDNFCYQHIKTKSKEYIYSLEDVDSISFAKRDESLEEQNFVNAMSSIFPIINKCSGIDDVESHIDAIKAAEGVEHAWTDGHQLYIKIEEGEVISFHFSHNESIEKSSIANIESEIKALAPRLLHIVKPDGSRLKFAIANQQDKDESRKGQKNWYFLPLTSALNGCGIEVDYIPEPSVDFFYNNSDNPSDHLNFYDYDAVILSTHGSYSEYINYDFWFGDSYGPKVHTISLSDDLFKEEYESDDIVPNWHDNYTTFKKWRKKLNLKDVTDQHISYCFNKETRGGKLYWVAHPSLTEFFFRDIAQGEFKNPNSIFFNCACQSLMENDSFADELMKNHGLGVYAGYTESNYFGQLSSYTLFSKLFSTLSLERAYQELPSYMRHESLANINISSDFDIDDKIYYQEEGVSDARLKILPENSLRADELFILPVYTNFTSQENLNNEYNNNQVVKLTGTLTCLTQVNDVRLGFLYSTGSIPTQEVEATSINKIINLGKGNLEFSVELPNIERGQTYTYRAFTDDGFHYNYGDICSFTIPNDLQLSSDKIILTIGETSTIQIISGSGDYGITGLDDASTIATVTLQGTVITINPIKAGDAIFVVTDMQTGKQKILSITINKPNPLTIAEAIDLGLPSGTLWASWNLGATKPEESGDYYSWGETNIKEIYDFNTYQNWKDANGDGKLQPGELSSPTIIAGTKYDAATVNWGAEWYTPTYKQVEELLNNTTSEWVTQNGVDGRRFTSNTNGNSIFLPVTGFRTGSSLDYTYVGHYWSSTEANADFCGANYLEFCESYAYCSGDSPFRGFIIRPVKGSSLPDNSKERDELIKLYNSTNGDSWTHNDNWCSSKSLTQWYGITCDKYNEHVEDIKLANNNLTGSISIKGFEKLRYIDIKGNNISSLTIDNCPTLDLGYLDDITLDFLHINNCCYDFVQHFMYNVNIKKILFTNFQKSGRIFLQGVSDEVVIKDCVFDDQGVGVEDNSAVKTMTVENSTIKGGRLGGDVDDLVIKNCTIGDWWVISAKSSITIINSYIEGHLVDCSGTPDEVSQYVYSVIH